jgi:uncharacterized membrane protein (DUF4010 family)
MEFGSIFARLAVAAGLGLLVGLQRERASRLAGLRTFTLITLFGFLSGLLSPAVGGWLVGAGVVAVALILTVGSLLRRRAETDEPEPGTTTEVAAVLMYAVGAYLALGEQAVAVAAGAGVAALLAFKGELHSAVRRLSEDDVKAIMQFALLSLVILPALPDRTLGPFGVLNPRQIWWMVVLIVGVGLSGYVAHKFAPERAGLAVNGVLGGVVSSTATALSYARSAAQRVLEARPAAAVILLASAVSFVRIMVEVAVVAPPLFWLVAWPLAIMMSPLVAVGVVFLRDSRGPGPGTNYTNPSQLRAAVLFAGLYAAVLLATAAAKEYLGQGALYGVAVVSGLTDVDAVTLSTSRLVTTGVVDLAEGWRLIVAAAASNLASKSALVAAAGNRALWLGILVPYIASLAAAVLLVLWR